MKLSIITINLNNIEGLRNTIASITCQDWKDYEWIIIDGGSNDGSLDLIKQTTKTCFNISYWCSEPDGGIYNAMNKGIYHAKGDYINFMNSGDVFASSTILGSIFGIERNADILYGYMMRRNINGEINNALNMKPKLSYFDFFYDTLGHQSTFTKKTILEDVGGFDESFQILADWAFFIKAIFFNKASYEFIPLKISVYECDGLSETPDMRKDLDRIRKEFYPIEITDNIWVINNYKEMQSIFFFRLCNGIIRRLYNFYTLTFKK